MKTSSLLFCRRLGTLALLTAGILGCLALIAHEESLPAVPGLRVALRLALVATGLGVWFYTQRLIGSRAAGDTPIGDGLLDLTAGINRRLAERPGLTDRLLIASSLGIDLCGLFLLIQGVFGPTLRPFLGLLLVFGARQVCQKLCALKPPPGLLWRHPGFPSLLVTYDVGNDFFFSGHTAISALAALELARLSPALGVAGGVLTLAEIAVVIVLRAHYTMDIFAALTAAYCAASAAAWISATVGF